MDWVTLLKDQQADFIKRLKLGHLLQSNSAQHSELTTISNTKLDQLRSFCWDMAEKFKQKSNVRDAFINNMKGKLAEEVIKYLLGNLITEIDYEKRIGGDGKVDFQLTSDPSIGIQVKARCGDYNSVGWSISKEELEKNEVLICVLIQEEVSEALLEYNLIFAGFITKELIQKSGKLFFKIDELLYSGGLYSYLNNQKPKDNKKNCIILKTDFFKLGKELKIENSYPDNSDRTLAYNYLSITWELISQGNYKNAIEHLNKVIDIYPNCSVAYHALGICYYCLKIPNLAIANFQSAILATVNELSTHYEYTGRIYCEVEYINPAHDCLVQAIQLNPDNAEPYYLLGTIFSELKYHKSALLNLDIAIKLNPDKINYYLERGKILLRSKNYKRAYEDYSKLIELKYDEPEIYYNRAFIRFQLKDYEGSIKDCNKELKLDPLSANSYFLRGQANECLQEMQKALEDYEKAAALYKCIQDKRNYKKVINRKLLIEKIVL